MARRSGAAEAPTTPSPPLTKRFRIESELGRGGMGAVYRAREISSGREVALKTLFTNDARATMLFEREYHVLASIKHPSVIDVFDFDTSDDGQRFYTMEILPGDDLAAASPLPWKQASAALRDIATSLALLHARRLVHRDVSPRNIRFDVAGRAKLIDFGALAGFGVPNEIVGTPLCIAPEVARHVELDQRSDLFSLGVVLYMALTGRKPFPVRSLHDVEAAHSMRPSPPSAHVPEVPRALDDLVLSLLSIDPIGRPSSAAEVIERLGAIAELDEEPLAQLARSHLLSTALCGREREKAQLAQHVQRTLGGHGSVVIIEAATGMGRSRLAGELLIDARLAGITTLRIDALANSEAHGVMRAVARLLFETSPAEATETLATHLPVLGHALPELRARLGKLGEATQVSDLADSVGERRSRIHDEFVKWVLEIAARKPLLLVVDDVQATDPTSAGVLIGLAHAARNTRLLLVVTQLLHAEASVAIQQLARVGARIKLRPLPEVALDQMLASAFGDVPHRNRLTHWLYSVSHGNPAQSLDLLGHLVSTEVIRYAGGAWVLPPELSERDLPANLEDALRTRLASLSTLAREIAELLAVHQGAFALSVCAALFPNVNRSALFGALDELLTRGLAVSIGDTYRLRQETLRGVLLEALPPARIAAIHLALGNAIFAQCEAAIKNSKALSAATPAELGLALQTGFHFLKGHDEARGRNILREAGIELTHRGDGLGEAIPALEAALAIYRKQGRHAESAALLLPLTLAGAYVDFRLIYRYADPLMKTLSEGTGIALAARLGRFIGHQAGLWSALVFAAIRYPMSKYRHASRNFRELLLGLISLGSAVIGSATPLLDRDLASRTARMMAPLGWFPRRHAARFAYDFALALVDSTHGRYAEAHARGRQALHRLKTPNGVAGLPDDARIQLEFGLHILLGSLDTYRTDGSVHKTLAAIDTVKTSVSRQTAAGVRATYHANRGERALFEQHQREVDVLAAQAGSTWRQDVLLARNLWWPYAMCEDVMGLKQCVRQLEAFAAEAPSLAVMRDAAHACYLAERGMHAEALERYGAVLQAAAAEPNELSMRCIGALARLYRKTGQYERAEALCRTSISAFTPAQMEFEVSVAGVQIEHVLALANLGRYADAITRLEAMRTQQEQHDNPLLRGLTHKAWAWIALQQKDGETFRVHLDAMHGWFRRTDNPSLIAQCRSLAEEGRRRDQLGDAKRYSLAPMDPSAASGLTAVRSAFGVCRGPADRLQTALDLLLSATRAQRGHLYVLEPTGLRLGAPLVGLEPPEELREELAIRLNAFGGTDDRTALTNNTEIGRLKTAIVNDETDAPSELIGGTYRSLFLLVPRGGDLVAVGAVALVAGEEGIKPVDFALLEEIARGIYDAGDVQSVFFESRPSLPTPVKPRST